MFDNDEEKAIVRLNLWVSLTSGALFATSWWLAAHACVTANALTPDYFKFTFFLPLIFGSVGLAVMLLTPASGFLGEGDGMSFGEVSPVHRTMLYGGTVLLGVAPVGCVWAGIANFIAHKPSEAVGGPPIVVEAAAGWELVAAGLLMFVAGAAFKFGRKREADTF